jgi:O-antigen ligase
MYEGGAFSLTNSLGYYLEVVAGPFIMFWLGNIIAKDTSAIRRVFQALALTAAIFALHTIIEATTGKFLFESARAQANLVQNSFQLQAGVSRAGSFFGNPNGNGAFLATSFFLPLALFIESTSLRAKVLYLVEMLAILLALMFTYSNGSWIATLVGLMIFLFLVGRVRYSVLLTLLIVSLAGIALVFFPARIAIQLAHARDQGDLSLHLGSWATAFRVLMAYPLFGVGLGTQAYLILAEPYRVSAQTKPLAEPDNSYLQWGAIAGIPTMLIFLVLLGLVFWFAWRNWLAVETRYRVLFAGGICALIALSIDSLTVDGWTSPIDVEFLGWLIAGVVATPLIVRHLNLHPISAINNVHARLKASRTDKARQGS